MNATLCPALHGGLAHVNKHRDVDGKVVYSGTTDLVDGADCAYTLDTISEDKDTGVRTVRFENFKSRGDVVQEAAYKYNFSEALSYYDLLASVSTVGDEERAEAEKQCQRDMALERNREAVEAIKECLREGIYKKTSLIKEAAARSGISRQKVIRALRDHTGSNLTDHQYWQLNIEDNNAHAYMLNLDLGGGGKNWKTGFTGFTGLYSFLYYRPTPSRAVVCFPVLRGKWDHEVLRKCQDFETSANNWHRPQLLLLR